MSKEVYTNVSVQGSKILYRGIINGKRRNVKYDYKPTIFLQAQEPTEFKTLHGGDLSPMEFPTIRDAQDFIRRYQDIDNFKMYGNTKWEYNFINNQFPDEIKWDINDLNIVPLDIEVDSEGGYADDVEDPWQPIVAIALELSQKRYVLGVPSSGWEGKYVNNDPNVTYVECETEIELLQNFIRLWSKDYPDIITGWYIKEFDIPYIINRIRRVLGPEAAKKISPWNYFYKRSFSGKFGKTQTVFVISGIATLDYMDLYRKFDLKGQSQDSYSLDNIAWVVLKKRKVNYSEYANLAELYRKNYQKFIDYNLEDMDLIRELEEKIGLISLALTWAYDSKVNFEDVFSQVRMWTVMIHNELLSRGIVGPQKQDADVEITEYIGAYVKEPRPGRYGWVVGFDLTSLYPHLIMQYNVSPERLVEPEFYTSDMRDILSQHVTIDRLLNKEVDTFKLKNAGVTLTPNGQFFYIQEQGFLANMMQSMFEDRDMYKKKMKEAKKEKEEATTVEAKSSSDQLVAMYNNLQGSKKISLNSCYGSLGNIHFFLYDTRQAEAITSSGQLAIRWVARDVNLYLNKILKTFDVDYIIASDTDSIYLNFDELVGQSFGSNVKDPAKVTEFLDAICKQKITPVINKSFDELGEYLNVFAQKMNMNREAIAYPAIWTAKKRYILNVWDMEGTRYKEPDIKISGLEAVKSSTPRSCREKIRDCIKVILDGNNDDVIKFIESYREEFKTLPLSEIAFPRSANFGEKSLGDKGLPIAQRAAILYNKLLVEKKLTEKYVHIKDGEKIKFIHLKLPNPVQSNVVGFLTELPKEFDLHRYVDYNTQFEKAFVEPIRAILSVMDWKVEYISSLENMWT